MQRRQPILRAQRMLSSNNNNKKPADLTVLLLAVPCHLLLFCSNLSNLLVPGKKLMFSVTAFSVLNHVLRTFRQKSTRM